MNAPISPETEAPLSDDVIFWAPADRAEHLHTPNAKRGLRLGLATLTAGVLAVGVLAGIRSVDHRPPGEKVAPRGEGGTYVPLPTLQPTTTINQCIVEFKQLVDIDAAQAHAQFIDCRDNGVAHTLTSMNAAMRTTTTTTTG